MVQLLCAPDTMGEDVDILTLWYPMMPDSSVQEKYMFLRRWITRGTFIHIMHFRDDEHWLDKAFSDFFFNKDQSWFEGGSGKEYDLAIHWGGGWEGGWGKHGDGRCHLTTREGYDGVWMQNWHFGPLGFQMLGDMAINVYLEVRKVLCV
jgi:hypothetical protein